MPPRHHPPSARAPRGAHPLSLRVPPAVPQQTAPAPFISSLTARPGRCRVLPLKSPEEPGPGEIARGGPARHSRDEPHTSGQHRAGAGLSRH